MWFIEKYRSSKLCTLLFLMLLAISIYITFYDRTLSLSQLQQTVLITNKRTSLSPNDFLNVRLNLTYNSVICHANDHLILYILSTATNFRRRQIIRSTWASPVLGTCFVFILAKIPTSTLTELLIENEKRRYKDIVQIDHMESYQNVIYKEVAALQWSHHFYPLIPYLFKTDDDLIVDTLLVSSMARFLVTNSSNGAPYILKHRPTLLKELSTFDRSTLFRGGWSNDFQEIKRTKKFAISESIWSEPLLPPYCSGFGWIMSKDVRDRLVDSSHTYPLNKTAWVGDVFLSGFLAMAADIECEDLDIDYHETSSGKCACYMTQRPMLTICSSTLHTSKRRHSETAAYGEYENAWNVIHQRHSLDNRMNRNAEAC